MKICQSHWDRLRSKLYELGIGNLGAKSEESATRNIITELEGRGAENDYDPLMDCNNMILSQGLNLFGLSLMESESCPICEAIKFYEQSWIDGPTLSTLEHCKKEGLVE